MYDVIRTHTRGGSRPRTIRLVKMPVDGRGAMGRSVGWCAGGNVESKAMLFLLPPLRLTTPRRPPAATPAAQQHLP